MVGVDVNEYLAIVRVVARAVGEGAASIELGHTWVRCNTAAEGRAAFTHVTHVLNWGDGRCTPTFMTGPSADRISLGQAQTVMRAAHDVRAREAVVAELGTDGVEDHVLLGLRSRDRIRSLLHSGALHALVNAL